MPELAEVALYARDLNQAAQGQKLLKVSFPNQTDWGSTIIPPGVKLRLKSFIGKTVLFSSAGKALHISHALKAEPFVEFRLGMTGQFHLLKQPGVWKRHYFLSLQFEDFVVHYADPRRFGRLSSPQNFDFSIGGYSPTLGFWKQSKPAIPKGYLTKPKITWLLSNGDKTGVGNYMANEALGILGLSPFTPCKSEKEAITILKKCRDIAAKSFKYNGNSFGSGYYLLDGTEGDFGKFCKFYGNLKMPKYLFNGRPIFTKFKL